MMKKVVQIVFFFYLVLFFSGCNGDNQVVHNAENISSALKVSHINSGNFRNIKKNELERNDFDENLYDIEYVYDGDTYSVIIDGKKEKIRVLGIDTPEKKGGFRPEGCFGNDASLYAKKNLLGKKVGLLKPKKQKNRDKYGRLLRYVFLDGKDFGANLIEEGYAFSYKRFPHERLKYYNELEKKAQKNKKGMWNPKNCEYWGQNNFIN